MIDQGMAQVFFGRLKMYMGQRCTRWVAIFFL
jgi:hypothetical protein